MKAIYLKRYGGPEEVIYGDLPDPVAGGGEVLVRVQCCSLNPLDYKVRSGALSPVSGRKFPRPLGSDFSGTVEALGSGVPGWKVGDEVYGHANIMFGKPGALAELVVVPGKNLRLRPEHLSMESAACFAVAGTTALNGLVQCGDIRGKVVAVTGASGGVGHIAVQIAKARGASVVGTASAANEQFVKGLGADRFLDYRASTPADLGPAHVFFDAFGSTPYAEARAAISPGGFFVSTLPNAGLILRRFIGARIRFANRKTAPALYQELEDLTQDGKLRLHVGQALDLKDGARALQLAEQGGTTGKIIVRVRPSD